MKKKLVMCKEIGQSVPLKKAVLEFIEKNSINIV